MLRADGLDHREGDVLDYLTDAYLGFCDLPVQHDDDEAEFRYHIHMAQGLLAMRVARRAFPAGWNHDPLPEQGTSALTTNTTPTS